ncbi:MAG TPA: guanylate kinase [Candidatus Limnocylindrales bacterium]|nr:guanylate kinase [Candidatus Limnocylindrales bacterium]
MSRGRPEHVEGAPGALLVIISGPSGVGKDTILRRLREHHPNDRRQYVVTYKTRARRPGETDGVDYHFVSEPEFERLMAAGAFLETALVHGHWSGTPRDQVVEALTTGRDAILKIDVQGARAIRELVPHSLLIFVAPPSMEALDGRLRGRATETADELARRQQDAALELARQGDYDHVVVNETGQVARTAARIDELIAAEHARHPDRRIVV